MPPHYPENELQIAHKMLREPALAGIYDLVSCHTSPIFCVPASQVLLVVEHPKHMSLLGAFVLTIPSAWDARPPDILQADRSPLRDLFREEGTIQSELSVLAIVG